MMQQGGFFFKSVRFCRSALPSRSPTPSRAAVATADSNESEFFRSTSSKVSPKMSFYRDSLFRFGSRKTFFFCESFSFFGFE